jgi:type I restriction enzyme M protein
MLFLQTLVSKMEAPEHGGGRVGIVLSGSPLFNGGAGSGESEIRRWLLEQDFVEAIFSLPNDMFFNTGIGTYVWLLSNKKARERKGKVQLVNLNNTWTAMRKSECSKRRYLSEEQIDDSLREYDAFTETSISKVFDSTAFGYRRITVERPYRLMFDGDEDGIGQLREDKSFRQWDEDLRSAVLTVLITMAGSCREKNNLIQNRVEFRKALLDGCAHLVDVKKIKDPQLKLIEKFVRKSSENAAICHDKQGKPEADADLRDFEMCRCRKILTITSSVKCCRMCRMPGLMQESAMKKTARWA